MQRYSPLVHDVLSPLVRVLLAVRRVSTGSPSRAAACVPAWRPWERIPALPGMLLVLGNDSSDCGGRCFSAAVGMRTGSGQENSSEPDCAFLPAAVWGKGGSDIVIYLYFFFPRVRTGRAETSFGARASCSLSIPIRSSHYNLLPS